MEGLTRVSRKLPPPRWERLGNLGAALCSRRSIRSYLSDLLDAEEISLILASACGVTDAVGGARSAPSGGACYPIDTYLATANGTEFYDPDRHALVTVKEGDARIGLAKHSYHQGFLIQAPAVVALCADYPRIMGRYGSRGRRYAILEAGHIAQNIHLAAASLGLGSVAVGAFDDGAVAEVLGVEGDVLYLIPVGHPKA